MTLVGYLVVFALIGVVFGAYTGLVAQEKGYGGGAWFAGGFFFQPRGSYRRGRTSGENKE